MDKPLPNDYFKLHLIVLILGFTAILGKLISLPALELVWYRMLFAIITLTIYLLIKRQTFTLPLRELAKLAMIGVVIAVHWFFFFEAIKVSNVSVALGCLSVTTLFASFLEPFFFRKKISILEVIIGMVIILGIYLIFTFEFQYTLGILYTLVAAFLASLFSVLNKKFTSNHNPVLVTFYEMIAGFITISLMMPFFNGFDVSGLSINFSDFIFLLLLGTICTAYAFSATIKVLQKFSAYQVVLAINLEPIYGILAALFIFGESEKMTGGFYAGASIILASVIFYSYYRPGNKNKK